MPQSSIISSLDPDLIDDSGFIKTQKSLQISDPQHPNIFAVGDVAATGAHKAAKPGSKQATLVTKNIGHLLVGESLENYDDIEPPGIHLTLGIVSQLPILHPRDVVAD